MNKSILIPTFLASLCLLTMGWIFPQPLQAQSTSKVVVVKVGTLYTGGKQVIKGATLVIKNGIITKVVKGKFTAPKGSTTLDYSKKVIMPAMIDSHSQRGCEKNLREKGFAFTPELQILDAFDMWDRTLNVPISAGVGTMILLPGHTSVLGGQGVNLQYANKYFGYFQAQTCAMKASLHSPAIRRDRRPTSLPEALDLLEKHLAKGREKGYTPGKKALAQVLAGKIPLITYAQTATEAKALVKLSQRLKIRGVVAFNPEAHKVASQLAGAKVPVVLAPLDPSSTEEELRGPARLAQKGVKIAFSSDAPRGDERNLLFSAALAVKYGLPRLQAIQGLTSNPAEIYGLKQQGRLAVGYYADFLVFSGDPLSLSAPLEAVYLRGKKRKAK